MILTLEALNALHGDALLLHYGDAAAPKLIVIDGGPRPVFAETMKKRLDTLQTQRARNANPPPPLNIRLLMVSHMDRDHIAGVIDLLRHLERADPYRIDSLWHNSFEDLVKTPPAEADAARGAALAGNDEPLPGFDIEPHGALVLASINEGREVRRLASRLNLENLENLDHGTDLVVLPTEGQRIDRFDGLTLTVLGPPLARVEKLREEWKTAVAAKNHAKAAKLAAANDIDHSVFNLSSIVVLAEADGHRMLLTGDARGDDILAGLKANSLLDGDGRIDLDLLKLPHHGSSRNVSEQFFRSVRADHYVISANGRDGNPDQLTFERLIAARKGDEYTIHLTNEIDIRNHEVNASLTFLRDLQERGERFHLVVRPDDEPSLMIHLGLPLPGAKMAEAGRPPAAPPVAPKKPSPKSPKARQPKANLPNRTK